MYPGMGIVSVSIEKSAKSILHRACSSSIYMTFNSRQMDNVLSKKIIRYHYITFKYLIKYKEFPFRLKGYPLHILFKKIKENRYIIMLKKRFIEIEIFAFKDDEQVQIEVMDESVGWVREDVPGIAMIIDDTAVLETNGNGAYLNEAIHWEWKMGTSSR